MENQEMTCNTSQAPALHNISGDQEVWLIERLVNLVSLCEDIRQSRQSMVVADNGMIEGAIMGAVERQAVEICYLLNCQPAFVNLPKITWKYSDRKMRDKVSSLTSLRQLHSATNKQE